MCVCVCVWEGERECVCVVGLFILFGWIMHFGDEAVLLWMFVSVLFISYLKMYLFFAAVLLSCTHV